ncbi:MAG TPA: succinylglutamate desuccinylase/aspartoacylase family protein [Pseudomonadales bacterium]|nr:succinylglutamate desuccinylase/aspartoacylase family protein [Pseudomonadales bacterium]
MQSTPPTFTELHDPAPEDIGANHLEFLHRLKGPVWINVAGRDTTRSRAIVTLLHGNEPSGLKAIHRFLAGARKPATNLGIFIGSVNAAQRAPAFSHRFLPDEVDLNRCFNPPYTTDQRKLAEALLARLVEFSPEAIIDAHNTSAHSEPFAVADNDDPKTLQLAQIFARRLVVLDLQLGTLIEQHGPFGPSLTIEFGGLMDPRADQTAVETLSRFAMQETLFDVEPSPMTVLRHPLRLELAGDYNLHYSSSVQDDSDITIFNTIDQLNFSRIDAGTPIGWLCRGKIDMLKVQGASRENLLSDYFREEEGFIVAARPLILFMATTDAYIARKDCLLYLTPQD